MYPSQLVRVGGILVGVGVGAVECSGACNSAVVVVDGCGGVGSSACLGDCLCGGASARGVAAAAVKGVAESAGAPSCNC